MTDIEKYQGAFGEILEISEGEIINATVKSLVKWDSIAHVCLIFALEEAFDIEFNPDEMLEFDSYEKGIEILRRHNVVL